MARLFDIKQECIWKYLLMGEAQPFGPITDFWRRVEVFFFLDFFFFFISINLTFFLLL